jgi:branched-chain amino acid transport system substrate-binding protein
VIAASGITAATLLLPFADHALAQPAKGEPILLGAVIALTGPGAGLGGPERNGMLLAEKVINERGGVKGRPIKILIEDDGSKPDIAKSKAENLIYTHKVKALLGPSLTASTNAVAPLTNAEGIPQVCFTGLGPQIEYSYKSLFHALPPQQLNARALLEYATKYLRAKKVGILHDTGYGQVVMNNLKTVVSSYKVDIAAVEKFEVGATDVTTQAAKIKSANPDVVFVITTSPIPFRNVRQIRMTQPIVAAIGSATYEYVRGMGEFADDIVFAEFVVAEAPLPHQRVFVEYYRRAYPGVSPKNFDAAAWDAVHQIAAAMNKVGPDAPPDKIAAAMRVPYQGVFGQYNFAAEDMTGLTLNSYVFSKLTKGNFSRVPFTIQ